MQKIPLCFKNNIYFTNISNIVNKIYIFISNSLDDQKDRNCDYILAINFFTAYLLQKIGKLKESLNFISVADTMINKLLLRMPPVNPSLQSPNNEQTSLDLRGSGKKIDYQEPESYKKSRLTKTIISNYILGLTLMKNIALKFTNPRLYQSDSVQRTNKIAELENKYGFTTSSNDINVSYLVEQYQNEILDKNDDIDEILKLTFTREFNNMLQVCVFIPFLSLETPRPQSIPRSEQLKLDFIRPKPELLNDILRLRQEIMEKSAMAQTSSAMGILNDAMFMSSVPEQEAHREEEEDESKPLGFNKMGRSGAVIIQDYITQHKLKQNSSKASSKQDIYDYQNFENPDQEQNLFLAQSQINEQTSYYDSINSINSQINQPGHRRRNIKSFNNTAYTNNQIPYQYYYDGKKSAQNVRRNKQGILPIINTSYQTSNNAYDEQYSPLDNSNYMTIDSTVSSRNNQRSSSQGHYVGNKVIQPQSRLLNQRLMLESSLQKQSFQTIDAKMKIRDELDQTISKMIDSPQLSTLIHHPKMSSDMFMRMRSLKPQPRATLINCVPGVYTKAPAGIYRKRH